MRERLFNEFYRFSFFRAVQLLEALHPEKKALGGTLDPKEEAVRFSVKPGLAFAPSEVSGLSQEGEDGPVHMEVAFMGLLGPSGVLPHWYNELALEREREKDNSFPVFLDVFHHRLISLFYLAWKKYRFEANYLPGAKDRLSKYLLSLIGLGTDRLSERIGLSEESLVFYGGLLSRQVPSAVAIESAVEYFSGTKARVEQFIERVITLDPEDRTRIGAANSRLGQDAVIGSCAWENQTKFRINLGPMGWAQFLRFLPDGDLLNRIFALVRYVVGMEYEFEIRVFLKREEVPLCELGADGAAKPRLGWSTWIKTPDTLCQEDPHATFEEGVA